MKEAYIHGSVEESPSGQHERSLERPGANTPRPYPRIEIHHGSLNVSLAGKYWMSKADPMYSLCETSPILNPITKTFKADLSMEEMRCHTPISEAATHLRIVDEVGYNLIFVQPTAVAVVEPLRQVPMVKRLP